MAGPRKWVFYVFRRAEELHKVTHVRLDREHIGSVDNLLLFSSNVTNIYLQHVRTTCHIIVQCFTDRRNNIDGMHYKLLCDI